MEIVPKKGFAGLIENWQSDLIAAFSVTLVALPLGLGIALASGVPPMAGILSAIIGGVVTTFFRGSYVAINGPTAGLIAVVLASLSSLDDGTGQALNYVLAAFIVAGAIQVLLGLLKLGRFADIFHSSVIRGILAAIGVIIFATQIHIALGTNAPKETTVIESLADIFSHIPHINPFVAIISMVGFLLLIFQSKISYKLFHLIPAPIWILVVSIPFVFAFNFFEDHDMMLFGNSYNVGPHLLIEIPDNLLDAITHPNFSKIDTLAFWLSVISIAILASIESLAAGKAIDKLDQYKRKTDMNKDLIGIGLSTMVSGALGGLPVITVIVRSTVNVHNHAKTKWSNFYHGILLIIIVFLLKPVIQMIPLCSLAIILVYAGFKLASPKVLKQVYDQGLEQLIFFLGTLIITLYTDLLRGIFGGLFLTLTVHVLLARLPVHTFFKLTFNSGTNLFFKKDGTYLLKIKGIANFLSAIFIDKFLLQIPSGSKVVIDFSEARLVGFSILEDLYEFQRNHDNDGGNVKMIGLEKHISSTDNKLAIKLQVSSPIKLTNRQIGLKDLASEYGWQYRNEVDHNIDNLQTFYFFKSKPIEFKENCISGMDEGLYWELADVTFEEGAFMAIEEYNTTLGLIDLPYKMPKFVIEKKGKLGKYLEFTSHRDIDYVIYEDFPETFKVKVEDKNEMKEFMSDEFKGLIQNSGIRHIESNGDAILIFNDSLRFAQLKDYSKMLFFTEELRKLIKKSRNGQGHIPIQPEIQPLNP